MSELTELRSAFRGASIADAEETIVSFENRSLKLESEEDAAEVAAEIDRAAAVDIIIFKGNTIGVNAANKIGQALAKRKEFKRALWSDMFTGRSKQEIPPALIALCRGIQTSGARLVELDLSDNAFGPNGARGIEEFLRSPSAYSLQILKLNNNGLGITGGKMVAAALNDCHRSSVAAGTPLKLRVFVGGRNRLENDGAIALADCFKKMGTMEEVTMPQNGIYAPGIAALAAAFAENINMRVINLSDNTLTEKGASAIADVLPLLGKLSVMNLDDCLLKPEGGFILASSLTSCCAHLEELRLNGNEFTAAAGLALVESLATKPDLKVVELNANSFGAEGIEAIINLAAQLDLCEVLGTFDDDEGLDGSEGDSEEAASDQTRGEEEINGNVSQGDSAFGRSSLAEAAVVSKDKGSAANPNLQKLYLHPDAANLIELDEIAPDQMDTLIREYLKNPDDVVGFVFGVAALVDATSNSAISRKAQICCEMCLKQAFENKDSAELTNIILEHLGVIKSENITKKPKNISGVLTMLSNAVKREWFPARSRSILAFVLEERRQKIDAEETLLAELMRGLQVKN